MVEEASVAKALMAFRVTGIICGVLLILLGIVSYVTFSISSPLDIILPLYYM